MRASNLGSVEVIALIGLRKDAPPMQYRPMTAIWHVTGGDINRMRISVIERTFPMLGSSLAIILPKDCQQARSSSRGGFDARVVLPKPRYKKPNEQTKQSQGSDQSDPRRPVAGSKHFDTEDETC